MNSQLKGMEARLPEPMGKTADESRDLLVQVPLPLKGEKPVHVRYGDIVDTQLLLNSGKAGLEVVRGEVLFGGGVAVLPAKGRLRIAGSLPTFDETQWSPFMGKEPTNKAVAGPPLVSQVDMDIGELKLPGIRLDKASIKVNRGDKLWDVDVMSDQVQGRIQVPDASDAPVTADMDRLYLPRFKKGGSGESAADPRKIHPLDIKAKSFRYGDLDLGEFQLQANRIPAGLEFVDAHTHSDLRDLKVSGKWVQEDGGQQSSFKLVYDGKDTGGTLAALGFAGVIKDGKAHTDMQLKWQGAPTDFSLAKAAGSLSFEIKDGQLLDVNPGAGRVLGLLSFQALPRRLTLDFSDLFQKGFAFDKMAGSFTIENGDAQTDNMFMTGPAARIEVRGRVGLATEDYDQRVTVIPNITAGLPMAAVVAGGVGAGALTGGVGAGAALLLMQKMLKPGIDKLTKVEYRVTGPWTNPTIELLTKVEQDKKSDEQGKNTEGK